MFQGILDTFRHPIRSLQNLRGAINGGAPRREYGGELDDPKQMGQGTEPMQDSPQMPSDFGFEIGPDAQRLARRAGPTIGPGRSSYYNY